MKTYMVQRCWGKSINQLNSFDGVVYIIKSHLIVKMLINLQRPLNSIKILRRKEYYQSELVYYSKIMTKDMLSLTIMLCSSICKRQSISV